MIAGSEQLDTITVTSNHVLVFSLDVDAGEMSDAAFADMDRWLSLMVADSGARCAIILPPNVTLESMPVSEIRRMIDDA